MKHAEKSIEIGDYDWTCLASHQSLKKRLKLFIRSSKSRSLESFNFKNANVFTRRKGSSEDLANKAKELDRRTNPILKGLYYTREDAERAVSYAREILEFCRSKIL